jgi:hypothetical protein
MRRAESGGITMRRAAGAQARAGAPALPARPPGICPRRMPGAAGKAADPVARDPRRGRARPDRAAVRPGPCAPPRAAGERPLRREEAAA